MSDRARPARTTTGGARADGALHVSGRAELRFQELYQMHYRALYAFALRRCEDAADAHDVVADSFLVLWRRIDDAPEGDEALLWLFGVARRVLANHQRGRSRRERLIAHLRTLPQLNTADSLTHEDEQARAVLSALPRLNDRDREVLLLAAWEDLSHAQIARVLSCSEKQRSSGSTELVAGCATCARRERSRRRMNTHP